jgi:hypothetical protein
MPKLIDSRLQEASQQVNAFVTRLAALAQDPEQPKIDLPDVYGDTWTRCVQAIQAEIDSWGRGPAARTNASAQQADRRVESMNLSDDLTWAAAQAVRAILVWDREKTLLASREVYRPFEKLIPYSSLTTELGASKRAAKGI